MTNIPPPTVPGSIPAAAPPLPSVAIPAEVQAVSDQLAATLAALKQQAVLAVTKAELDVTKQLLTLQTPQGAVSIKMPATTPNTTLPSLTVTLPNGQTVPLGELLKQISSLPPAALKNIFVQLDKPAVPGQLPPLKILLNPQDVIAGTKIATVLTSVATPAAASTTTPAIRTSLTPIPESAARALGLLTPQPQAAAQQAAAAPSPLSQALSKVQEKVSSLIGRIVPVNTALTAPTPVSISPTAPTSLNPKQPVDILTDAAPDAVRTVVLGATPKGEAIVRTDAGQIFSLTNIRTEKPGSVVFVRNVLPTTQPTGTAQASNVETLDKLLAEMVQIMQSVDPAIATRLGQQLQASPGPQLGGALLMIFSVLSGGALTGKTSTRAITLADEIEKALPEGTKGRLLAMLNDDPVKMTRLVPDQIGVEWRGHQLPTPALPGFTGPVWFYVQQQRQDEFGGRNDAGTIDKTKQTRFVIDMDFTRLGHTQLEGIASPKRVDLKINIGAELPEAMQKELRDTYANSISAYGLAGTLSFSHDAAIDLDGPHDAMQVIS